MPFDHRERAGAFLRVSVVSSVAGNAGDRGVVEAFGHETEVHVHAGGDYGRRKKIPSSTDMIETLARYRPTIANGPDTSRSSKKSRA
jgi:hypothetical protein